ncbi:serine acetyltransferase [Planctomycetales bacterium ZRK34]|nr:serine acetyltransferase [Planctomycetales bacterium ZRK34]
MGNMVSETEPDWSRESIRCIYDPPRKLLHAIRRYGYWKQRGGTVAAICRRWHVLRYRFWSIVTGAEIPLNAQIAGGLALPHPQGIVIHASAVIGPNCLIFHQVTLGNREGVQGAPRLGGAVIVGAGAKILGPVTVGDHARIGANAVVVKNVPTGATVVGIPAQVINPQSDKDESA